jgi:membrane dipeptidase
MPKNSEWHASLARVLALLERVPLIDGHNDLALTIRRDPAAQGDVRAFRLEERRASGDTDIPRLREGGVSGQVWAAYVPSEATDPARQTLDQINLLRSMNDVYANTFMPVMKSGDFLRAKAAGKIGSMIAVEGGIGLGDRIETLQQWHSLGVRLMTLCHNSSLPWVDSSTDDARAGGLSAFGQEVIAELNRLRIIVDCSHAADDAIERVLEVSRAPILCSHSNSRQLCASPRNLSDDLLRKIGARDGMVMATFVPQFVSETLRQWVAPLRLSVGKTLPRDWGQRLKDRAATTGPVPEATLSEVADHIEYLAHVVGANRIGIGSDFYSGPNTPTGLEDVSRFPHLLVELANRGWSDDHLAAVAGFNFISFMERVETANLINADAPDVLRKRPASAGPH